MKFSFSFFEDLEKQNNRKMREGHFVLLNVFGDMCFSKVREIRLDLGFHFPCFGFKCFISFQRSTFLIMFCLVRKRKRAF